MGTNTEKDARKYTGLELTAEMTKYARNEIPAELMEIATPKEYSISRLWRARDVPDMMIRALSDWYYRLVEFPILKHRLAV